MLAFAGGGSLLEPQDTILSAFHARAFLLCNRGGDAQHDIKAQALSCRSIHDKPDDKEVLPWKMSVRGALM
jgi:hypothetical protein